MSENVKKFLEEASVAYYAGCPIIPNEIYDALEEKYGALETVGAVMPGSKVVHENRMYSLTKVFDDEVYPLQKTTKPEHWITTPKLDGAAIQLTYDHGILQLAATRGDGHEGQDITTKIAESGLVPLAIMYPYKIHISGEVVVKDKDIENSRNYASGALAQHSMDKFLEKTKNLLFVAYSCNYKDIEESNYINDMKGLENYGFNVVTNPPNFNFPTDGKVCRLIDNLAYFSEGFTSKHPKGAYARKSSNDVEIKETTLREVIWQVGSTGKVTPVAIFDEIVIDDAKINRATLHNAGFVLNLDLRLEDVLLVTRSGGIIPKVVGKL